MTRKHFEAIAAILNDHRQATFGHTMPPGTATWEIAGKMAGYFETVSPNFDREKFLTACGL